MGCFRLRCTNLYHIRCAQQDGAVFFQDKVSEARCCCCCCSCKVESATACGN